jgi:hypothetical protein
MVEEARLEQLDAGLTPVTDGWFVVNVRHGAWMTNEALGATFVIEGDDAPFPTDHGFVATGDGPCVIFMTGAHRGWPEKGIVYPRSELALRHGAGVEKGTASPAEAYASFPKWQLGDLRRPQQQHGVHGRRRPRGAGRRHGQDAVPHHRARQLVAPRARACLRGRRA